MGVIKFLRDISGLFNWNTDDNPTSELTYMNAVKNWQETEKNLVDTVLWQPTTAYTVGNMVKTPSLPSQYCLVCTTAGTSGANEPSYSGVSVGDGVSDGSVTWVVRQLHTGAIRKHNEGDFSNGVADVYKDTAVFSLEKGIWLISGVIGTSGNAKYVALQPVDSSTGYIINNGMYVLFYIAKGDSSLPVQWIIELTQTKTIKIQIRQDVAASYASWYFDAVKLS